MSVDKLQKKKMADSITLLQYGWQGCQPDNYRSDSLSNGSRCQAYSAECPNRQKRVNISPLSNFLTSLFISVRTNAVIKDSQCGFRAYHTDLARELEIVAGGFQYESEILMRAELKGYRIVHREIPVVYDDEPTQMNNITDTLRFMKLWFRSFFW